jgi:hypothetical protein
MYIIVRANRQFLDILVEEQGLANILDLRNGTL